jgi:hypothetical protein
VWKCAHELTMCSLMWVMMTEGREWELMLRRWCRCRVVWIGCVRIVRAQILGRIVGVLLKQTQCRASCIRIEIAICRRVVLFVRDRIVHQLVHAVGRRVATITARVQVVGYRRRTIVSVVVASAFTRLFTIFCASVLKPYFYLEIVFN